MGVKRRIAACILGMAALAACGGEDPTYASFGEVCGAMGPFRVLALAPDQRLPGYRRPLRVEDRILFEVARRDPKDADEGTPRYLDTSVWATGPCGEAPVEVARHTSGIFTLERWPGVALACDDKSGDIVSLDPSGTTPPHPVFIGGARPGGCYRLHWTEHGLLKPETVDDELGALVLYPYPDDPRGETATPRTLLDAIRWQAAEGGSDLVRGFDDFALAVTADDELVRVDLPGGAVSVVQPGVFAFDADADGRYIVWQDITPTNDPEMTPAGQVYLRDLEDGTEVFLGQASLAYSLPPFFWAHHGLLALEQRIFRLPGLEIADLPVNTSLARILDAQHWLLISVPDFRQQFFEPDTGTASLVMPTPATVVGTEASGVQVLQVPTCCIGGTARIEGAVWFTAYDGSPPRRLAERATRFGHERADHVTAGSSDAYARSIKATSREPKRVGRWGGQGGLRLSAQGCIRGGEVRARGFSLAMVKQSGLRIRRE